MALIDQKESTEGRRTGRASQICLLPTASQAARQAGGSGSVQLPTAARPWCWKALMGIRMADTARGYMVDAMAATTWGSQFWLS